MGVICSCLGIPFIVAILLIGLAYVETKEQRNAILFLIAGAIVLGILTFFSY